MNRTAKLIVIPSAFLLLSLVSCKPRKAIEFKETIVQKERIATEILIGKNGSETKKLECLVKEDYKGALAAINQQEKEFNEIIKAIEALPAGDIKQGNELKTASVNYYIALKELHMFDRLDVENRQDLYKLKGKELDAAQDKTLELSYKKQDMFDKVFKADSVLRQTLDKFTAANNI
jgi:hypothetical protein